MDIVDATFFSGPNRHVRRPAMEVLLDLGSYAVVKSNHRMHFIARLESGFPGLSEHHCSRGYRGGFAERLREGTYLGHVVEHVALECLYLGGERGVYGKTREAGETTVLIVFESETESGGVAALQLAIEVVEASWDDRDVDINEHLAAFRGRLASFRMGPSTRAIVDAARRRDIPVTRLDDQNLVRLGQGVRQRRIMASMTDATGIVGVEAAQDKRLTARLVGDAGIPVPEGRVADSVYAAVQQLSEWGGPLVLKPSDGHHGRGVVMNLSTEADLRAAYLRLCESAIVPPILERQVSGTAYRLLVIGGELVAATERRAPEVIGDGVHSLEELIAQLNKDPRRGPDHGFPMSWVAWDEDAAKTVAEQGWMLGDVVPAGTVVRLRSTANMSTGASARDVTAEVGSALARDAVRAARAVGLDVAGIDIVVPRLDVSLAESGGAVIEVNAAPGLRMHLYPESGAPRPVADKLVEHLFKDHDGRIPVAAVTGTNGKTTVTRMLGHIASRAGRRVGMSTTDGISIAGESIKSGDLTGPWSARLVLNDPTVEMAILETARGGMARGGLGFDDLDVAVVTNIGRDHLGQDNIETLDDLVHLKALLVEVVRPSGKAVLNADDAYVRAMADRCRGEVVLFSTAANNPYVAEHLAQGGKAVYAKRGCLYYGADGRETRLIGTRALPASLGGVAAINVANAAAAAAAGLALGLSPREVAAGLKSFPAGGAGLNRGRLEMMQGDDVRVLVDYGHNVPAITALGDICRRLRSRTIITVLGLPGDRRDDDIRASAEVVAGFSQRIIVREDADRRGRAVGEVAELIKEAVQSAQNVAVEVVLDEGQAVRHAVMNAEPGSLVLVLYERYGVVRDAVEVSLAERESPKPQELLEQA